MSEDLARRYSGQTVLAIGAHPDDLELGLGGTVAKLSRFAARVVMAVACVPSQFETRLAEARRAAGILGGELRLLLDEGPCRVEDVKTYELVRRIDELVLELQPSVMFSHGIADFHKDHRLIFNACLSSMRLKPFDFFCYSPTSCRPNPLGFDPQAFVDISDTIDVKMRALDSHPSQFGDRGLQTDFLRDLAREHGRRAYVPYAEGLAVVRMTLS